MFLQEPQATCACEGRGGGRWQGGWIESRAWHSTFFFMERGVSGLGRMEKNSTGRETEERFQEA